MLVKSFKLSLLFVVGCLHQGALAFPAPVEPNAPAQTEVTPKPGGTILADAPSGKTGGTILADAPGGKADGKTAPNAAAPNPAAPNPAAPNPAAPKTTAINPNSKAAGLTQAELMEACAPLLAKDSKTATPAPAVAPKAGGGAANATAPGGKTAPVPAPAAKPATPPAKNPNSASTIGTSSTIYLSAAIHILLSTGFGWIFA